MKKAMNGWIQKNGWCGLCCRRLKGLAAGINGSGWDLLAATVSARSARPMHQQAQHVSKAVTLPLCCCVSPSGLNSQPACQPGNQHSPDATAPSSWLPIPPYSKREKQNTDQTASQTPAKQLKPSQTAQAQPNIMREGSSSARKPLKTTKNHF